MTKSCIVTNSRNKHKSPLYVPPFISESISKYLNSQLDLKKLSFSCKVSKNKLEFLFLLVKNRTKVRVYRMLGSRVIVHISIYRYSRSQILKSPIGGQ